MISGTISVKSSHSSDQNGKNPIPIGEKNEQKGNSRAKNEFKFVKPEFWLKIFWVK